MKAEEVLAAIRAHHSEAAIVHEMVVDDPVVREAWDAHAREMWPNASFTRPGPSITDEQRVICDKGEPRHRRIDALMVKGGQRTAIEVKVTRSDFRRDTAEKRRAWASITHRFVYAVPAGLIRKDEVPDGCGLWEVEPNGRIKVTKRARQNRKVQEVPDQLFVALCYRAMRTEMAVAL